AVAAAKYPPVGRRSGGGVRPLKDFKAYVPEANKRILVAVMIETSRGVEECATIAAVPEIGLVLIGGGDPALALEGSPERGPTHEAAVQRVLAACRNAGRACGLFTFHTSFALERRRQGFQLTIIGTDSEIVSGYAKAQVGRFTKAAEGGTKIDGAVALV